MELSIPTQFEQMCRACMSCDEKILQSLFDYVDFHNARMQIFELLNMTVQNLPKIEIMDALPKNLCTSCVQKLCTFYEFQNCCLNSDQHLRQLIVTSMVSTDNISADPLQGDIADIENFIKQEMVEVVPKDVENLEEISKDENSSVKEDYDRESLASSVSQDDEDNKKLVENDSAAECGICQKQFLYKRNLMRHIKRVHEHKINKKSTRKTKKTKKKDSNSNESSNEDETWACNVCKKVFTQKKNLQRHKQNAHEIQPVPKHETAVSSAGKEVVDVQTQAENKETGAEKTISRTMSIDEAQEGNKLEVNSQENMNDDKSDVERVYLCEICETEFSYKKNLKRHMKRAHDFEWPKDILMESEPQESNVVKKNKQDNCTWTCEICKTQFLYKRNLRRHMKRTHNEESPIEIKTGIEIIPAVAKHEKISASESSAEEWEIPKICIWTCERCQKKFTLKKNLKRHMKHIHKEEMKDETPIENNEPQAANFKCDECGKVFHKKVYLRKHKYRHKRPGGLKKEKRTCDTCEIEFKTLQLFREHVMSKHPERLEAEGSQLLEAFKLYQCQYCNKSFLQSCTLKDHLRVHTKEQPFLCSQCGKAFNSNSNLKQHVLRHETEKRYECPECPKKFPCLSDLSSHMQVHKQLKPHVCDLCNAAFGKPYQLKLHKMYHNGEKRYQCEYCAMRFVCGDHLRRHIRTHTGEKPYKCKYCPRSFSQSNDMIKHLRTHLGENVYQCELCPAAFRLAAELRSHFAQHKNDDEETKQRNKVAWHEAQDQLKLKLESERASNSRSKEVAVANDSLLPQGNHFLLSIDQQV